MIGSYWGFLTQLVKHHRTKSILQIKSMLSLRKHANSNILKISPSITERFQIKILIFFHISAQNIDCGYKLEPPRRGGSNGKPQSMFLSRNKKNNEYPYKPLFHNITVGFKGSNLCRFIFVMETRIRARGEYLRHWQTTIN